MLTRLLLAIMMLSFSVTGMASVTTTNAKKIKIDPRVEMFAKHRESLMESSRVSGVKLEVITAIASHESGIGIKTRNAHTKRDLGIMGYTDRTWNNDRKLYAKQLGLPKNVAKSNARANIMISGMGMAEDIKFLKKNAKVPVTDGDVFMARFVGRYGAKAIMNGNPNAPISRYIKLHPGNGNMYKVNGKIATVKQFRAKMNGIVKQHQTPYTEELQKAKFDMFVAGLSKDLNADRVLASL